MNLEDFTTKGLKEGIKMTTDIPKKLLLKDLLGRAEEKFRQENFRVDDEYCFREGVEWTIKNFIEWGF